MYGAAEAAAAYACDACLHAYFIQAGAPHRADLVAVTSNVAAAISAAIDANPNLDLSSIWCMAFRGPPASGPARRRSGRTTEAEDAEDVEGKT